MDVMRRRRWGSVAKEHPFISNASAVELRGECKLDNQVVRLYFVLRTLFVAFRMSNSEARVATTRLVFLHIVSYHLNCAGWKKGIKATE